MRSRPISISWHYSGRGQSRRGPFSELCVCSWAAVCAAHSWRGRNSKDNRPVLKEQVRIWLSHGRLSRLVLAFATAPFTDGGAGAGMCCYAAPRFQKK